MSSWFIATLFHTGIASAAFWFAIVEASDTSATQLSIYTTIGVVNTIIAARVLIKEQP
jgi:hypothetical protein